MKDYQLAADFAALLTTALDLVNLGTAALDESTPGIPLSVQVSQSDASFSRPLVAVEIKSRPLDAHGFCFAYTASFHVETDATEQDADGNPCAAVNHGRRVEAVRAFLFGATAAASASAKASVSTALAALGNFTLRGYDSGLIEIDLAVQTNSFETVLPLAGVALITDPS